MNPRLNSRLIFLLPALAICLVSFAEARDWSQFRGPNGQGHSDAKGLPTTFAQDDLDWKIELPGKGPSSPVFWEDHLYLTVSGPIGADGEKGTRGVVCLDADSGKELWKKDYNFTTYRHHKHNDFASSTPCADDKGIYITWTDSETREVFSLDHDGKERWRVDLGSYYVNHGSGGSPIVIGEVVVIVNDVELDEKGRRFLVGLNRDTGKEVWRTEQKIGGKAGFYTPTVFTPEEGDAQIIATTTQDGVFGLDPKTGKQLWTDGGSFSYRTVAQPLLAGDQIFISAGSGGGGKESAWVTPGTEANKWKARSSKSLRKNLPYVVSPVADDELLYLWGDRGILTAIDIKNFPKEVYSERVGERMNFYASPVLIDGKLYGVSREGQLIVVQAGKEFKVLGTTELGERSDATPAVHDGKLYLRTYTHVLCLPPKK